MSRQDLKVRDAFEENQNSRDLYCNFLVLLLTFYFL